MKSGHVYNWRKLSKMRNRVAATELRVKQLHSGELTLTSATPTRLSPRTLFHCEKIARQRLKLYRKACAAVGINPQALR